LPNNLPAYFISDPAGNRLNAIPPPLVKPDVAKKHQGPLTAGLSCILCHDQGLHTFNTDLTENLVPRAVSQDALKDAIKTDNAKLDSGLRQLLDLLKRPDREPLGPVVARYLKHDAERGPREVGGAMPILPFDALTLPHRRRSDSLKVEMIAVDAGTADRKGTDEPKAAFKPKERMVLVLKNDSADAVWLELTSTDWRGNKGVLKGPFLLGAGKTYRYPQKPDWPPEVKEKDRTEYLEFEDEPGVSRFTLFACEKKFPGAVLLTRGADRPELEPDHVGDRLVHPFYVLSEDKNRVVAGPPDSDFNPQRIVKMSLDVETLPKDK
jgi:hypothetical protein